MRPGIHPNRSAEARRDRDGERETREPVLQRDAGQGRQRHRATGTHDVAVTGSPPEPPAEAQHEARESLVGDQHVGSLTQHDERDVGTRDRVAGGGQILLVFRFQE